jgi:hypothetical protein
MARYVRTIRASERAKNRAVVPRARASPSLRVMGRAVRHPTMGVVDEEAKNRDFLRFGGYCFPESFSDSGQKRKSRREGLGPPQRLGGNRRNRII